MPRLRVKQINTVGFVDKGDDPEAAIVFWKRDAESDSQTKIEEESPMRTFWKRLGEMVGMSPEEADKLLADGAEGGSDPTNSANRGGNDMNDVEKLQAEKDALLKRAEEAESRVAELEKAAEEPEPQEPEVPEELQKRFEALEARAEAAEERLQKAQDERERERYIQKASGFTALPGVNPDDFGPLLRKAEAGLDDDERAALNEILKSANQAMLTSRLYAEIGGGTSDTSSTIMAEVTKLAEEKRKDNPKLSMQAARGQVMKERKDLRDALEQERAALTKHLRTED